MSFDQIAWFPLCAGLTAIGLVLGFLAFRRRGAAAGLRVAAWSLIPIAAYLTGALPAAWKVGTAVVGFFTGLVFSPTVWAGVAVAGLSVVLFMVSGVLRRRRGGAAAPQAPAGQAAPGTAQGAAAQGAAAPTKPNRRPLPPKSAAPADDDLSDIEEILKRRGIS
ncbi:cellulose synthase [Sphaerisporangium sp. NPDC088356]|uniref:cellulose synthase n=1 Tax=Sphaerisporangium sp. NPDC088356 TaxID=3154871 RepID=UPI003427BEB0